MLFTQKSRPSLKLHKSHKSYQSDVISYEDVETDDIFYRGDIPMHNWKKLIFTSPPLQCVDEVQPYFNTHQLLLRFVNTYESQWFRNLISRIDERNLETLKCERMQYNTLLMKMNGEELLVCKCPMTRGTFDTNVSCDHIQFPTMRDVKKGDMVTVTLEFSRIWHMGGKHGATLLIKELHIIQ